jgi:hypothetical protein
MKTPREILLERHRAVDAKLDALRRQILQVEVQAAPPPARTPTPWLGVVQRRDTPILSWRYPDGP